MNLDELVNRPRMYAEEDGAGELAVGLCCVLGSGVLRLSPVFGPLISLFIFPVILWRAKKLKEQITSPRGGYVALDEPVTTIRGRRIPLLRIAIGAAVFISIELFVHVHLLKSPPARAAAFSAIVFGAYTFSAIRYRTPWILWFAAFSALIGVWAYARNADLAFVLFWQGAAFAVYGGARLWRFVKSHPRPIASEV